jgi:hypothetical protein
MKQRWKYLATPDIDCVRFRDPRDASEYGYVEVDQKPYPVRLPDGELVGTVNALCDALPLILEHHEREYLERRRCDLAAEKQDARCCSPFKRVS